MASQDYNQFFRVGYHPTVSKFSIAYQPSSDEQIAGLWFRMARVDAQQFHSSVYAGALDNSSISEVDVNNLTVSVYKSDDQTSPTTPSANDVLQKSTTIPWDLYPELWADQDPRDVLADFSRPVQLEKDVWYWIEIDWGFDPTDEVPKYAAHVYLDRDIVSGNAQEWAVSWDGTWYNDTASWESQAIYGIWYRKDTESQASGPRHHVVIDGKGYMTPGNLHSAMESSAVPFSGKIGSGQQEWSDLQYPYSAHTWDGWLGGIGVERAADRPTGYTMGAGIDTRTDGQVTLMPAVWETSADSSRPPRNFDEGAFDMEVPFWNGAKWMTKLAIPFTVGAATTVAKLRTAMAKFYDSPWYTTKIRVETDNAGAPSGTAVTVAGGNDLEITVAEGDLNRMMTWITWDLGDEVGGNWSASTGDYWIVLQVDGFPTGASRTSVQPVMLVRGTGDYWDLDEFSGGHGTTGNRFYYDGSSYRIPQGYDGSSWGNLADDYNPSVWRYSIQWNMLDEGLGGQIQDFVYWPDSPDGGALYAVGPDTNLFVWNEGSNQWDGYWSEAQANIDGGGNASVTNGEFLVVFDSKLYISRGYSDNMYEITGGSADDTLTGTATLGGASKTTKYMHVAAGFLWASTAKDTIAKYNGASWSSGITVGTDDYDVTGFALFQGQVHIAKEDGVWYVDENDLAHQRMNYEDQAYAHNGKGITNFGELLYFNVLNSFWRWTGATIDFKGPYDGFGSVPEEWTGIVIDTVRSNKHLYAALWSSTAGTSQVLAYNGIGWHPIYAPIGTTGNKIRAVYWTPGTATGAGTVTDGGRLWISEDSRVRFIELPIRTDTPSEWADRTWDQYGWIELPWLDFGLREVTKYFRSIKVEADAVKDGRPWIRVGAKVTDGLDREKFHDLGRFLASNPGPIEAFLPPDVSGKSLKIIIGLASAIDKDYTEKVTPVIRSVTVSALLRPPSNYVHNVQLVLGDDVRDMQGTRLTRDASEMWRELKNAAESTTPIRVQFPWGGFNAFITSLSARTRAYREEGSKRAGEWERIAQISFIEAKERGI